MKLHHQLGTHPDHSLNSSRSFICPPTERISRKYKNIGIDKTLHITPIADNKHAASPKTFKLPFLRLNQQSPVQRDSLAPDSKDRIPDLIISPFPVQRFSRNEPQTPSSNRSRLEVNGFQIGFDDTIKGDTDYNLDSQRSKMPKGDIEAIFANMRDISVIAPHSQKAGITLPRRSLDVPRTALDEMLEIPFDHFYKPYENKKMKKKPQQSIFTFLERKFPLRLAYRRKSCYCTDCGNRPKIQKDIENNPWVSLLTGWDEHKIADTYITRLYKPLDKDSDSNRSRLPTYIINKINKISKKRINIKHQADNSKIHSHKPGSSRNNLDEKQEGSTHSNNKAKLSPKLGLRSFLNLAIKRNSREAQTSRNDSSVGRSTIIHSGASSLVMDRYEDGIDWYTSRKRFETSDSQQEPQVIQNLDQMLIRKNTKLMSRKELSSLAHVEVSEKEDSRSVSISSIKKAAVDNNPFKLKVLKTINPKKDVNIPKRPLIIQPISINKVKKEQRDDNSEMNSTRKIGENGNRGRHTRHNEEVFMKKMTKVSENILTRKVTVPNLYTTKTEEEQNDDIIEDERGKSVNKDDRDVMRSQILLKNFLMPRSTTASVGISSFRFNGSKIVDSRESSCKKDEIKPKKKKFKRNMKLKLKKLEEKKSKDDLLSERKLNEIYNLHNLHIAAKH